MRYVLGPGFGPVTVASPDEPRPADKPDAIPTIGSVDAQTVTLQFPSAADAFVFPSEVRNYLIPSGSPLPATVDDYLASSLPVSIDLFPADGRDTISFGLPIVPPGDYLGQVVLGFPD